MRMTDVMPALRRAWGRSAVVLHHGLAMVGFVAVMVLLVQGGKILPQLINGGAAVEADDGLVSEAQATQEAPEDSRYRPLAEFLAHRYKVASDATERMVDAAHVAGQKTGLDPLLILAVMAVESRFNPIAESAMGAKGLMQVMPDQHQDKLGDLEDEAVLDPATNILVGARILKEYILRAGSPEAGLQMYAGALSDTANLYAQKVFAEKDRMAQVLKREKRPRAAQAQTVSQPVKAEQVAARASS